MSEEHTLLIENIRKTSILGPDLKKIPILFVEYLLDNTIGGVLQIKEADYSKEEVLKRVLELEAVKHPDIGSEIVGKPE